MDSKSDTALLNLTVDHLETVAKWLSCNGEIWGVGPTLVFASAAALFLYNELTATVFVGSHGQVYMLEKTLISTMVLGMLALMIHLWVCSMRFFQYYLDTLIRESPNMLLEMTTAGLLGGKAEMVALGPLTRFLRQQQPQIHITVCWFLSLCYADYIRKNYCQRFNLPYLEQWQSELHERAVQSANRTIQSVNSIVGSVHQRLRGFAPDQDCRQCSDRDEQRTTVTSPFLRHRRSLSVPPAAELPIVMAVRAACWTCVKRQGLVSRRRSSKCGLVTKRARPLCKPLRNSEMTLNRPDVPVQVHRTPAYLVLCPRKPSLEDCPWRHIEKLQYDSLLQ